MGFFKNYFTDPNSDPFEQVKWKTVSSQITGSEGEILFYMEKVEAPENWSQLAIDIAASKYFRKTGVPHTGTETSVRQMIARVVETLAQEGVRQKIITQADAEIFQQELTFILLTQRASFNSPVWFNCGLYQKYGIKGQGGQFFYDLKTEEVKETPFAFQHPQCSACFIQGVDDDLMSIFDLAKTEARIFKYGSGTGSNFARIRSKYEELSGGGKTSGLMSFLKFLDQAAAVIKSGGTTRRAAKMVCLDLDHPEIEDFILWKVREEQKVKTLVQGGYSADFNGEAYATVSGQNSNNSVRIKDEFIQAYLQKKEWPLIARVTGQALHSVSSQKLMRTMAHAIWQCADPGIQFHDTINKMNPCPKAGEFRASNPCSEFLFLDDSACNLASINLIHFVDKMGNIRFEDLKHTVRVLLLAQEILVDFSSYPTTKIAWTSHRYRPLGLGFANLGGALLSLGIPYSSKQGQDLAALLAAFMLSESFLMSAEMAKKMGPFYLYEQHQSDTLRVVNQHHLSLQRLLDRIPSLQAKEPVRSSWQEALALIKTFGLRHSQLTLLAPTGTIGFLMDCDTTGIEPEYTLIKFKKLSGGGVIKIVNGKVKEALASLGYPLAAQQQILDYIEETGQIEGAPALNEKDLPVFDCAHKNGNSGKRALSPEAHIEMMAAVQPFLSGAISKTINLETDVTVEKIEELILQSWKLGLKAVAFYRDGSKLSQPLNKDLTPRDPFSYLPGDAPLCSECGHKTVQSAGCFKCLNCGHAQECG